MHVEIDNKSGFCFGVVNAIKMAEEALAQNGSLLSLGDIVHNEEEVTRLEQLGLKTVTHNDLSTIHDRPVLLRAHGEPPSTYQTIVNNNIRLIDATCPVVIKLQKRIRAGYEQAKECNGQVVIYGKHGHAEVNGLVGQTNGEAIVVSSIDELDKIDFSRDIFLYSQTTKSISGYEEVRSIIAARTQASGARLNYNDTICRQVSNREADLRVFAKTHDVILFVSGKKSSNGKYLHSICMQENPRSHLISSKSDLKKEWLKGAENVGVCGATSTPLWLMEEVAAETVQLGSI